MDDKQRAITLINNLMDVYEIQPEDLERQAVRYNYLVTQYGPEVRHLLLPGHSETLCGMLVHPRHYVYAGHPGGASVCPACAAIPKQGKSVMNTPDTIRRHA